MKSENKRLAARKPRLYIFLVASGYGFLGGIVGIVIGFLLIPKFLPPWQHLEIDTSGHIIREIEAADFSIDLDGDPSNNNVILRDSDGNFFSFQQRNWFQIDANTADTSISPFKSLPCNDWVHRPPPFYFREIKDSVGVDFEHALASDKRCYVLYADGSLHYWSRYSSFVDLVWTLLSSIIGLLIGILIGGSISIRKTRLSSF